MLADSQKEGETENLRPPKVVLRQLQLQWDDQDGESSE
jgi:hypothetical protein